MNILLPILTQTMLQAFLYITSYRKYGKPLPCNQQFAHLTQEEIFLFLCSLTNWKCRCKIVCVFLVLTLVKELTIQCIVGYFPQIHYHWWKNRAKWSWSHFFFDFSYINLEKTFAANFSVCWYYVSNNVKSKLCIKHNQKMKNVWLNSNNLIQKKIKINLNFRFVFFSRLYESFIKII